jgi:hypothetical protein
MLLRTPVFPHNKLTPVFSSARLRRRRSVSLEGDSDEKWVAVGACGDGVDRGDEPVRVRVDPGHGEQADLNLHFRIPVASVI